MKAMLLAAGLGTRLRPLTYELPKPMVPILGRPVMEHILRLLARHGFDDVVANLHYFPDLIRDRFGDGSRLRRAARLLVRAGAAGHGRRRAQRARPLRRRDVPDHLRRRAHRHRPDRAVEAPQAKGGIATLALKRVDDPSQLGRRDRRRGRPHPGLPGEAATRRRRSRTSATAASTSSSPRSSTTSPSGSSWTGRRTCSRRCSSRTCSFYGHEIDEYWNDVGSLEEYRQGNFDALDGRGRRSTCPASSQRRRTVPDATPRSRARCSSARAARSRPACGSPGRS